MPSKKVALPPLLVAGIALQRGHRSSLGVSAITQSVWVACPIAKQVSRS